MRVHPSQIQARPRRWQLPFFAAFSLMAGAAYLGSLHGSTDSANAASAVRNVVVVKTPLTAGEMIRGDHLELEERLADTLPDEAITSMAEAIGHLTAGPIPSGIPLSRTFLAPSKDSPITGDSDTEAEERLKKIRDRTVAVVLPSSSASPARGCRAALSISNGAKSAIVAEEAWIEEIGSASVRVRVIPPIALFLAEAKTLGDLTFLELPPTGPSPFSGQAIKDIYDLKKRLEVDALQKDRPGGESENVGIKMPAAPAVELPASAASNEGIIQLQLIEPNGKTRVLWQGRLASETADPVQAGAPLPGSPTAGGPEDR